MSTFKTLIRMEKLDAEIRRIDHKLKALKRDPIDNMERISQMVQKRYRKVQERSVIGK